jgi:hypothetical protein
LKKGGSRERKNEEEKEKKRNMCDISMPQKSSLANLMLAYGASQRMGP